MRLIPLWTVFGSLGLAWSWVDSYSYADKPSLYQPFRTQILNLTDSTRVWDLLVSFGKIRLNRIDTSVQGYSAEKGRELVEQGWTTNSKGKKTARISKFFNCGACHSQTREAETFANPSPEKRLEYAVKNQTPFYSASTFMGLVNRQSFFNGAYWQRYLTTPETKPANYDLSTAIQVCVTQHTQGRVLEKWETQSIIAYLWTLEFKMNDFVFSTEDMDKIKFAIDQNRSLKRAVDIIENKYTRAVPATFPEPMPFRTLESSQLNDPKRFENGKALYESACLHCHAPVQNPTNYLVTNKDFGNETWIYKYLNLAIQEGAPHSLYKMTRLGLPAGRKTAAKPAYTKEKLSDDQITDLRIFIQKMANN